MNNNKIAYRQIIEWHCLFGEQDTDLKNDMAMFESGMRDDGVVNMEDSRTIDDWCALFKSLRPFLTKHNLAD